MILLVSVFLTAKRVTSFDRGRLADVDALAAFWLMLPGGLTDLLPPVLQERLPRGIWRTPSVRR